MSYDDEIAKICRLENGYEVEIYDPPKEEKKPSKNGMTVPYSSPWKSYAFGTEKEMFKFLQERVGGLRRKTSDEEYADSFKEATKK